MTEHSQSMNEDDSERHRVVETNRLKEARAVFWSRALVLGVLVASATTFAVATYYYCANEEQAGFQNQYANYAEEIIHVSQENVRKVFGHLKALSVATTSQVLNDPNVNWPFTTLPDFEVRGATARNSSQAIIIALLPMVSDADRAEWEAYSQSHQGWIQESHGESQLGGAPIQPIAEEIYRRQELNDSTKIPVPDPEGAGPYAPVWQLSPPPPLNDTTTINLNLFEKPVFKKAVDFANYTRTATFLDVCHQTAWFGKAMGDINHDLQTVVVQPVFSDFSPNAQIVAHYVAVIPWESFFREILPPHSECVTVVMSNTCDEVFSLEVEGSDARVVSRDSDARDPRYDNMVQSEIFADFANSKELLEAGLGEHCVYTISTYPTQEFENQHITNEPIWYTIVVVAIFAFASLVFGLYDFLLRKLQHRLWSENEAAHHHKRLVSSLFPAKVRDQLLHGSNDVFPSSGAESKTSLLHSNSSTSSYRGSEGPPIAELYPSATIMFADIAGFTDWCSSREPAHVFTLLESLYRAFDLLAKQQKVFKIETIGDCYVAVCGLPHKNENHPVVMAMFAKSCIEKFREIVNDLKDSLGEDTKGLGLRVGLHSGAVTAGVLRGDRARFQLFGDTVNTAARIESHGLAGRVHLSEQTAAEIQTSGRPDMVIPREDKIEAKGKGFLSTFWLKLDNSVPNTSLRTVIAAGEDAVLNGELVC